MELDRRPVALTAPQGGSPGEVEPSATPSASLAERRERLAWSLLLAMTRADETLTESERRALAPLAAGLGLGHEAEDLADWVRDPARRVELLRHLGLLAALDRERHTLGLALVRWLAERWELPYPTEGEVDWATVEIPADLSAQLAARLRACTEALERLERERREASRRLADAAALRRLREGGSAGPFGGWPWWAGVPVVLLVMLVASQVTSWPSSRITMLGLWCAFLLLYEARRTKAPSADARVARVDGVITSVRERRVSGLVEEIEEVGRYVFEVAGQPGEGETRTWRGIDDPHPRLRVGDRVSLYADTWAKPPRAMTLDEAARSGWQFPGEEEEPLGPEAFGAPSGADEPNAEPSVRSAGRVTVAVQPTQRCPFCLEALAGLAAHELMTCSACKVVFHRECLREAQSCSTVGCRNNRRSRSRDLA